MEEMFTDSARLDCLNYAKVVLILKMETVEVMVILDQYC